MSGSAWPSRVSPRGALFLAALAAVQAPGVAAAQSRGRDPAAAEALYKAGRDLLARGDWEAACPKFESSLELDPAASTQLNIAKCREHAGRLAQAWADYKRALVLNQETLGAERQKTLADIATRAIDALEPRLPKLKVVVRDRPAGLRVARDGQELPVATLGDAMPVDPGEHEISARAPGFAPASQKITAQEGKVAEVELRLAPESGAPAAAPAGSARPSGDPSPPDRPASGAPSSGGVPTWCWIVGGAGLVFVGAGVAFRIDAGAAESNLKEHCGAGLECQKGSGYDPADDNARKNRDFALFLALGGVGVAALGASVVGVIVGSSSTPPKGAVRAAPWVTADRAGLTLVGRY